MRCTRRWRAPGTGAFAVAARRARAGSARRPAGGQRHRGHVGRGARAPRLVARHTGGAAASPSSRRGCRASRSSRSRSSAPSWPPWLATRSDGALRARPRLRRAVQHGGSAALAALMVGSAWPAAGAAGHGDGRDAPVSPEGRHPRADRRCLPLLVARRELHRAYSADAATFLLIVYYAACGRVSCGAAG